MTVHADRDSGKDDEARQITSPDAAVILRTARRAAWRCTLRRGSAWLIAPFLAMVVLTGQEAAEHDQDLIDGQPHRTAIVLEVEERSPLERHEPPRITVDLGDRAAVLGLPFPGEEDVAPGDRLPVVVDPGDPEHVIAVTSHDGWEFTWWGDALVVLGLVALLGGTWLSWATSGPNRAARASARRAHTVRAADLVDVDGARITLRDDDGAAWVWTVEEATWSGPRTGELLVIGDLRDGAWPVLAAGRHLHWPAEPVRHDTGLRPA